MKASRRKFEEFVNVLGLHSLTRSFYQATVGRNARRADASLKELYRSVLREDALVFDIGANTGRYAAAMESAGAMVVALEPNADCIRHIDLSYHGKRIETIQAVAGPKNGLATINISDARDDLSSLSDNWMAAIQQQHNEYKGLWNRKVRVPMLTLDTLTEEYGVPYYIKIDVEGFEEGVLDGLSIQPPLLSFEFNMADLDACFRCLDKRIFSMESEFNFVIGDHAKFELKEWIEQKERVKDFLRIMDKVEKHGDIFVKRKDCPSFSLGPA